MFEFIAEFFPPKDLFVYLRTFVFVVYVFLACYILLKNPKSNLNRLVALFLSIFALWTYSVNLMWTTPSGRIDLWFVYANISSIAWSSFPSVFLLLSLFFVGAKKIVRFVPIYGFFIGVPMFFIYLVWSRLIVVGAYEEWYGWFPIWSDTIWTKLFNVYYIVFMVLSLLILLGYAIVSKNRVRKKEAIIIVATMTLSLLIGSITDVVLLQVYEASKIPRIADMLALIWGGGLVYAVSRYNFLSISPATAAENLISIMGDVMILLDREFNVVLANSSTKNLLGYSSKQLKGKSVEMIIKDEEFLKKIRSMCKVVGYEGKIKNASGKTIPVLLSASCMDDDLGEMAGYVLVAKDISELKKAQVKLKNNIDELEKVNRVMVGREMRIIEMKKTIKNLKSQL